MGSEHALDSQLPEATIRSSRPGAGGPMAGVAQRLLGGVARMMMDQFFGCMVASLPTGREDVAAAAEAATDA